MPWKRPKVRASHFALTSASKLLQRLQETYAGLGSLDRFKLPPSEAEPRCPSEHET
jgi:hypothetical protein